MSENGGLSSEIEDVIMQALTHRERRNILKIIDHSDSGVVYSGILGETGLSTGSRKVGRGSKPYSFRVFEYISTFPDGVWNPPSRYFWYVFSA